MARAMQNLAVLNSVVRTFLALVIVGVLGFGGWVGYRNYNASDRAMREQSEALETARQELAAREAALRQKDAHIADLNVTIERKDEEIAQLDTKLRLLKVDRRIAHLTVDDQRTDPETGQTTTVITFVEVNEEGHPIGQARTFELKGDMVYLDHWVVKFDDKYVEEADLDRATSIVLFRRIFGEFQEPAQGFTIDEVGTRPTAYGRGGQMSEFEEKIWGDFWSIANDPEQAKELGIRAAHGEAVSIKAEPGKRYQVQLRASGGLSITPLPEQKKPPES
jgi:hypothetical protein